MALTKLAIDRATYQGNGSSWDVRYDGKVPGFGVRIFPSGVKSFVLRYRTTAGNRDRMHTIGRFGVFTIDQARDRAKELLQGVASGADPVAEKRTARRGETVKALAAAFLEKHSKEKKKSWQQDERRIDKWVTPQLGHLLVTAVEQADVAALHFKIGQKAPYEANRVLALVRVMFTKAPALGFLKAGAPNPAKGIEQYSEQKRERFVQASEMPALVAAINAEPNIYIRAALWLYLLTGVRKSELLSAQWSQVDFDRRELHLPTTKSDRPHTVPLSAPAVKILRDLPRLAGNPHILPGNVQGKHLVNMEKNWRAIRTAAGCEDVRMHDLRRTVGSWLAMSGASLPLIGKVLNHSNASTTAIYARLNNDAPRAALEAHGKQLLAVVSAANGGRKPRKARSA